MKKYEAGTDVDFRDILRFCYEAGFSRTQTHRRCKAIWEYPPQNHAKYGDVGIHLSNYPARSARNAVKLPL